MTAVRVSFISSHAQLGGAERYLELLIGELGPEWVAGAVSLQDGPFVPRLRAVAPALQVIPAPARAGMLITALRLRAELRRQRPDVVHANGLKAALVGGLATAGTRTPVVWVKHDTGGDGRLANAVGRLCDQIVGVSPAVVATFRGSLRRKVSVVPNGIPEPRADAVAGRVALDQALGEPGQVVMLAGRLHPWKGQIELVEAAPEILSELPDTHFALVGSADQSTPEYAEQVQQRIRERGLRDRVHLLGHRDDLPDLMAAADVVVVPSVRVFESTVW